MKESEAFYELARRFAEREFGSYQHQETIGMCFIIAEMRSQGVIDRPMAHRMTVRIELHKREWTEIEDSAFAFKKTDRDVRVLAALFLALEAEDDEAWRATELTAC